MLSPVLEHGGFPTKQRFRANSVIEKAKPKTVLPSRYLQCGLFCGLVLFGLLILTGRLYCSGTACSGVFRNAAHSHIMAQANTFYGFDQSLNKSMDVTRTKQFPEDEETEEDPYQLTLDPKEFELPKDIIVNSKSPLWQSKSYFRQSPKDDHRAAGYGIETDLRDSPYVRESLLRHLLHALDAFAVEKEFVFWLAHGSLLGQHWGGKIMAEDTDVDVQTSIGALHRVRPHAGKLFRERFELHINPHYVIRKSANFYQAKTEANVIDARWLDTLSGHFIDITALATSAAASEKNREDDVARPYSISSITLQDKSVHFVEYASISPLQKCNFEDLPLWCPADQNKVLTQEYPNYKSPHHLSWRYNEHRKAFMRMTCPRLLKMYAWPSKDDCDAECREVVVHARKLVWTYLVVPEENHNQCQLEVIWTVGSIQHSRKYRGVQDGDDPWKVLSDQFEPVDWS